MPEFMSKGKILIIDDEKATHLLLKAVLKNDYEITSAFDADEGLNQINDNFFDLLLLDIQLPGTDGFKLLEKLKKEKKKGGLPVLMITGDANSNVKAKAKTSGASGIIEKSILLSDKKSFLMQVAKTITTG